MILFSNNTHGCTHHKVSQYGWNSWTTGAKAGTLVYIACFYGLLAALAWFTCLKGIVEGCMGKSDDEVTVYVGRKESDDDGDQQEVSQRKRNSKLEGEGRGSNQVDHQEMKEISAAVGPASDASSPSDSTVFKARSSLSAPIVSTSPTSGAIGAGGLRSSLRNKNFDPKLKALSKRGEVNVAFSSDP